MMLTLLPNFDSRPHLFLLLTFTGTWAHYIIDDNDTSVVYSSNHGPKEWSLLSPSTNQTVESANSSTIIFDYHRFYNQTVHDAYCSQILQCYIVIPFTGSGITIYGITLGGTPNNYTFTLDGNTAPAPVYPVVPALSPPIYNDSLYDLQALPHSRHTLTITIVNWNTGGSELTFDYAFVNETDPSQPLSSPSPTSQPSVSQHSHFTVGTVVGAICAGLAIAVIGVLIFLFFWRRRKRRARAPQVAYIDNELDPSPFDPYGAEPHASQPDMAYLPVSTSTPPTHYPKLGSSSIISAQYTSTSQPTLPSQGSSSTPLIPSTSVTDLDDMRIMSSSAQDPNRYETPAQKSSSAHANGSGNQLSHEQADFVHNLHKLNVPAPAIALVMDRMSRGPERVNEPDGHLRTLSPGPPQYTP